MRSRRQGILSRALTARLPDESPGASIRPHDQEVRAARDAHLRRAGARCAGAGGGYPVRLGGGIGGAEREELGAKARDYNVKVVTAVKSGEYLSGVMVVIESATKQPMLETTMAGPILMTKLPPGSYTIKATAGGATLIRTVTTEAQVLKQVDFRWDDVR